MGRSSSALEVRMDPLGPPVEPSRAGLSDLLDDLIVWFEQRRRLVPRALIVVATLGLSGLVFWWSLRPEPRSPIEDSIPVITFDASIPRSGGDEDLGGGASTSGGAADSDAPMVVHVAGAVQAPGVFVLRSGDRVIDAVDAAGGALPEADLSMVNLAATLIDGSQIRIPVVGEAPIVPLAPVAPGFGDGSGSTSLVDLNRATAAELETLTGVGPATAQAILTWRSEQGPFVTAEQLLDVPGIGPVKFAAMADQVVVS